MLDWLNRRSREFAISVAFLTRFPVPLRASLQPGELARALWAAPLVGVAVGALGGAIYWLADLARLPQWPAAVLALGATMLVTGCLHEDGLADVADGFGGGTTRERKLEIMRDSRIGTYGVCALLLSALLRVGALASFGDAVSVTAGLIAAHAAARAPLAAFMWLVPPARCEGLSAGAGVPPRAAAIAAVLLGLVALAGGLGPVAGQTATAGLVVVFLAMVWLCRRQIQGQTGDVAGALEQVNEMLVLLVAAAALS